MGKLDYKYGTLLKSQAAFERALELYQRKASQTVQAEREAYTASVIKHFELFHETLWRFLKFYLSAQYGIDAVGSKTVFRSCYDKALITADELEQLLQTVDIRNATVHVYSEEEAQKISSTIIRHYPPMKKLSEQLKRI